jgi:hypothetical protein
MKKLASSTTADVDELEDQLKKTTLVCDVNFDKVLVN